MTESVVCSALLTRNWGSILVINSFCHKIGKYFNLNQSWIIKLLFAFAHREIGILPMRNVESHYATTLGAINHQD